MEPTITRSERCDKLNALLRIFLYRSQAGIGTEELEAVLFQLNPAELDRLCGQLLDEEIICYAISPFGLVLRLTEAGIEWILSGEYHRPEPAQVTGFRKKAAAFFERYKKLKYFLLGGFFKRTAES